MSPLEKMQLPLRDLCCRSAAGKAVSHRIGSRPKAAIRNHRVGSDQVRATAARSMRLNRQRTSPDGSVTLIGHHQARFAHARGQKSDDNVQRLGLLIFDNLSSNATGWVHRPRCGRIDKMLL